MTDNMQKPKLPVPKKKTERQTDIYTMRKQKKRRRILRRSIVFIAGAILLIVIYQRRDVWLPQLETIGGQRHSVQYNDYRQTDGAFPITVYSGTQFHAAPLGEYLSLLSDSYYQVYEQSGSLKNVRQHTYGNAVLRTAGSFALIYESGGSRFRLETPEKTVYEKTVGDAILFGTVTAQGMTALITSSETCACRLLIITEKGQQIYQRDCVEQLAAVTFLPDASGCYAVSLGVLNGIMQSYVHKYSFSEKSEIWKSKPLDTFAISVYNTYDGGVCLIGDTKTAFLTAGGGIIKEFDYPDTYKQSCFAGDTAVLLLNNQEQRTQSVAVFSLGADSPVTMSYEKEIRCIGMLPESGELLLQMRSQLVRMKLDGSVTATEDVSENTDSFLRIGSDLYLLGYNTVDWQAIPE